MKTSRTLISNRVFPSFASVGLFCLAISVAFTFAAPLPKGAANDVSGEPAGIPPNLQSGSDLKNSLAVMVELNGDPAAVTYAAALKEAQAQADAARNYALAHPKAKGSKKLLKQKPEAIRISAAAARQVQATVRQLDQEQQAIVNALTGRDIRATVLFRAQRAYNGIAVATSNDKIPAIVQIPGVKAVHLIVPKFATAAFSDIDFLATRPAWTTGPFGTHGENIKIAVIDTGLDYIHRNFGGSGSAADYASTGDTTPVPNPNYPTPKIPGGTDLVGDTYNADPNSPSYQPIPFPDNNPFDCNGHGTACSSLATGFGVTSAGFTYSGNYNGSSPDMSTLSISPGFAPNAKLYPVRVFGCAGSTDVVVSAIEWSMDPNGDGDFVDKMDVVSMSLGANEGFADDPDDVAASNAASIGILVCSAAGNAGDSYYIHSSPAAASGTLGIAATFNDQGGFIYDSNVTSNTAGGGGVGAMYFSTKGSDSSAIPAGGITGNLVYAVPPDANAPALTNAAQVAGNIVIIDRGATTFTDKVTKGLAAGAIAVIIDNFTNNPNAFVPILMSTAGQPPGVDVMISRTSRDTIVTASGGFDPVTGIPVNPVNVTINNDSGAQVIPALAVPDTIPAYSSRGPRLPDSAVKPDISAPAEVVGVANPFSGTGVSNFNGTSSATPHVSGIMALLRQLHPAWTVQELNGVICATANHDLFTTTAHTTQYGIGRIGAGRVDVAAAARSNVTAYNGTDPNLIGLSFGVVEAPADSSASVTKNIMVTNKGTSNVTYSVSYQDVTPVGGASFTLPGGPITVNAGTSMNVPVTFAVTGSLLKHGREDSVTATLGGNPRQWLTEKSGYAVFTDVGGVEPTLRVALYAAPKPASVMHSTITSVVPSQPNTGSFTINLSGSPVNTGPNLGNGFDILGLVKAFELQYASAFVGLPNAPTSPNDLKYVGVTSDYVNRGVATAATRVFWGIEGFGNAATPDFASSDKEIFVDTGDGAGGPPDGDPDFAIYLSSTGTVNVFTPIVVNLHTGGSASSGLFTNGLSAAVADTNAYNNSAVGMMVNASSLAGPGYPALGTAGHTLFQYQVVTFDRSNNEVDETPVLTYDLANPGLEVENSAGVAGVSKTPAGGAFLEPFLYDDLATNSIPVNYNGTNFQNNGSLGVLLLHMHNGTGNHADMVAFRKPTVSGFSPTSGHAGAQITITGSNFGPGTAVRFFNNQPASVNVLTSNTLVATVPAGAVTGPIRVSNAAGGVTAPGNFTVLP